MLKRYVMGFEEGPSINGEMLHDGICVAINTWLEENPQAKLIDAKYTCTHVGKNKDWKELESAGIDPYKVVYSAIIIVEEKE